MRPASPTVSPRPSSASTVSAPLSGRLQDDPEPAAHDEKQVVARIPAPDDDVTALYDDGYKLADHVPQHSLVPCRVPEESRRAQDLPQLTLVSRYALELG